MSVHPDDPTSIEPDDADGDPSTAALHASPSDRAGVPEDPGAGAEREPISVADAAHLLNCSDENVRVHWRKGNIDGPVSPRDHVKSSDILVFKDSVQGWATSGHRRTKRRRTRAGDAGNGMDVVTAQLERILDTLGAVDQRLKTLERGLDRLEAAEESSSTAVAMMVGVVEEFGDAAEREAMSADLLRRASEADSQARDALRRAVAAQTELIRTLGLPGTVPTEASPS